MDIDEVIDEEVQQSSKHFIAGALAGTAEHCGMFPVDTIKTHIQARGAPLGIVDASRHIYSTGGLRAFFRGITAVIAGAAPAHAVYFASYEAMKKKMEKVLGEDNNLVFASSGCVATILSDGVLTPMDTVKQRRQLNLKGYSGTWNCLSTILKREGVRALYAGYTTTLTMNIPFSTVYFTIYEYLVRNMKIYKKEGKKSDYDPRLHFFAGAGAGMTAAALTNPLDVAKTRLQTQGEGSHNYKGMIHTLWKIVKDEGFIGLTRGAVPRAIFHSCSASILWTTYEYFKYILGAENTTKTTQNT